VPEIFLPDEIIATGAPFVKHDNAFYYIWGSRGSRRVKIFLADDVAIAHSTPFKSFHRSPKRNASNGGLWLKYKSLYRDREFDIKIVQCIHKYKLQRLY